MLMQVRSGFMLPASARGPAAPTLVGISTSADSATVSMPAGIASGDFGVLVDLANNSSPTSTPTDTLPAGWTRIGTTQTSTSGLLGNAQRLNVCYKALDGTETTLTGMTGTVGSAKLLYVFRKGAAQTWGTPSGVQAEANNSGATDKTITVGSGPMFIVGYRGVGGGGGTFMSPVETLLTTRSFGNGVLFGGYKTYGAVGANNTLSASGAGDGARSYSIGGFYVPLT
ncbi:MAG: hypothetical protein U1E23_09555 [Reyranellaceae bacterium]